MSFVTMESDNDVQFEVDLLGNPHNPPDRGSAISSGAVISPRGFLGLRSLLFFPQLGLKLKEPLAGQTEENIAYFIDSDTMLSPNLDRSYSGVPGQVRGYDQSQAQIYLRKPILLDRWEFEAARLDPQMLIEYRSLLFKKGANRISARSREFREFKIKYEVQLNQLRKLSRKKPKMLDPYEKGERFMVTTATEGYTLIDLPYRVQSRCFSMVDRWKIRRFGLIVPSIWDLPQQGHSVTPLWKDIFKEWKAAAALFPNADQFLCRLMFDDNTSNRLYKVRSISLAGSSNQARCSHNVIINMPRSYDASSDPQSGRTSFLSKRREVESLRDASSSVSIDMETMLTGARQIDPRRRPQLTDDGVSHKIVISESHMDFALNPSNRGSAKVKVGGESWLTDEIHQVFNITGGQLVTAQVHELTSKAQTSLSNSILLDPGELAVARSHPQMVIQYCTFRDKKCSKSSCGVRNTTSLHRCEICECKRKYEVQLGKLNLERAEVMDPYGGNERFMVTTAEIGYTLTGLSPRVISRCFSEADQEQITAFGLPVPSIWNLPHQGHSLKPLYKDIFKELEAESAIHPHAARVSKQVLAGGSSDQASFSQNVMSDITLDASSDPESRRASFQYENREMGAMLTGDNGISQRGAIKESHMVHALNTFNHGSAKVKFGGASRLTDKTPQDFNIIGRQLETDQVHEFTSQAQTSLHKSILLDPWELAVARSHPEMIIQYCSFRGKRCSKSSCGERNTTSLHCCEICECKRKYEVQLGQLNLERAEVMDLYGENERFMVTTAETGYILTGLSPRVISMCFSEPDRDQIAAFGLPVPSIWDLPQQGHLLKPLRKDILQELKVKVAVHPHAACVHNPTGFHGGWSNRKNASSGQASFSHNGVINMSPSYDAPPSPESRRVSFQLESRVVEPQPAASSDPETGTTPHQPERVEVETGRNATFLERVRVFFHRGSDQEAEPLFNRARMTETILVVAAQVSITLLTNGSSGSNSLSPNSEILKQFATICNAIGFLCCFCGILVCGNKPGRAARIITGCGYIASAYGFLAMMGMNLSDDHKLLFTAVTCIALFPVLAFALMK